MLDLSIAFAAAATGQNAPATTPPVPPAAQAAPASRQTPALKDIPGVTVTYYDVAGSNDKEIQESIAATRRKSPDGRPIPASTGWNLDANVSKRTENGQCTIMSVTPTFTGAAELPRLVTPDRVSPTLLAQWNAYVARLEASAAAHLNFIRDRIPQVQQAIAASTCDGAAAALDAAVARLKSQETAFLAQQAAQNAAEAQQDVAARLAAERAARERNAPSAPKDN